MGLVYTITSRKEPPWRFTASDFAARVKGRWPHRPDPRPVGAPAAQIADCFHAESLLGRLLAAARMLPQRRATLTGLTLVAPAGHGHRRRASAARGVAAAGPGGCGARSGQSRCSRCAGQWTLRPSSPRWAHRPRRRPDPRPRPAPQCADDATRAVLACACWRITDERTATTVAALTRAATTRPYQSRALRMLADLSPAAHSSVDTVRAQLADADA